MEKAIFWDRDGVINEVTVLDGKPYSPRKFADFKLTEEIVNCLKKTKELKYKNIVVTNQPDINRGLMSIDELNKMHDLLIKELSIDEVNVCPHDNKDGCNCRKPAPGLIINSATKNNIDLSKSYVIGDTMRDIEAGRAAGCKTILLVRDYNALAIPRSEYTINKLYEIFSIIS